MKNNRFVFTGKRGQFFMPLFAVITLIIFTTLYLDLAAKTDQFSKPGDKIGEKQAAVLNAAALGIRAQYYIDIAATHAYDTALLETARQSYFSSHDCLVYRGAAVVYGKKDCMQYGNDLQQKLQEKLSEEFNRALTPYLEAYEEVDIPDENYNILFADGYVKGIAKEPMEIPIFSITSQKVQEATEQQFATQKQSSSFNLIDIWPVQYDEKYINSCFGYREIEEGTKNHPGVDIRAKGHVPVLAVLPGTIASVDPVKWGMVVITHENGISTAYLHLDTIAVAAGQQVEKGTVLGTSGGKGYNRRTKQWGPTALPEHLHFEVWDTNIHQVTDAYNHQGVIPNSHVNPLCYFSADISYDYNSDTTKNCVAWGGPLKFCDLYKEQTGVSATSVSGTTTTYKATASTQAMLQQIETNYGKIIENAIQGTAVSKSLVIGLIAAESGGNPNAVSSTGCKGLMQFCGSTALQYGLCSDKKCEDKDERIYPEKAIPAGVQLLADNIQAFKNYKDKEAFALAAYNGGPAVVDDAIAATGKTDPSWSDVSAAITADIIAKYYSAKTWPTTESRNKKAKEIIAYPNTVLGYMHAYEAQSKITTGEKE